MPADQPGTKNGHCRSCQAERARLRRGTPEERARAVGALRLKAFGITPEEYAAMVVAQDGRCAICREEETATARGRVRSLAVDHDHETGAVRGLLCSRCNTALGLFRDNPALLLEAIAYLGGL
jgi:hypothetical protein